MLTAHPLRRTLIPLGFGLLAALALALLLAVGWLGAPRQDVIELLRYLLFSGLVSLGAGAGALAWLRGGRGRLWQQMTAAYSVGLAIAIFNVLLTARLMFISADHDLILLVLLLLFAAVVSLTLGATLAGTLAERVVALREGARAVSGGDLGVRVPEAGEDELADLAREFNRMAGQLAAMDEERRRMADERRDLIAAVSHDLRTPLASVRASVEALSDGLVEDEATVRRYYATIRSQVSHLSGLIDDLFELAQIDAGALRIEVRRASAGELAEGAVEGMRPQAEGRGLALRGEVAPGLPPVACDPQLVERVLYNLVSNAIRHTPAGGEVLVRAAAGEGGGALLEVRDTGEGIAAEDLPHVFERFYRGEKSRSRATGGAGLGLAIARGVVEAHGGRIWVESEPGRGTRVCFTLPAA
jgi:signal transduction histidine kinase